MILLNSTVPRAAHEVRYSNTAVSKKQRFKQKDAKLHTAYWHLYQLLKTLTQLWQQQHLNLNRK